MLAGKFSGICTKLFQTHCWATQTHFVAKGDAYDEFSVTPSSQLIEDEIEKLLFTDQATRADMAVALKKIQQREQQLQAANAELQQFTHIAAHHLQEPARRIVSFVQRLQKQLHEIPLDEEIKQSLEFIEQSALRQRALVQDIQLYLVAAEPRGMMRLESVENVILQIQKRFAAKLRAANATLITENLPPVFLDYPRLFDLFSLIIDNALSHGQPIQPDVTAKIIISGKRIGKLSRYTITDNGRGIPIEYHARVFEIFERLTDKKTAGSGIGLAIARRIVKSQHGKICIKNAPQTGVCVTFELPDGE
jgi:light-regulated signal transduction histidine kinase (bacteriophytochrome)